MKFEPKDFPDVAKHADLDSVEGQKRAVRAIYLELVLLVAVAVAAEFLPEMFDDVKHDMGWVAAPFLALAFLARPVGKLAKFDKTWFEGRAVAESLRTLSWRYMMQVPPFGSGNIEGAFEAGASEVLSLMKLRDRWCAPGEKVTPTDKMREVRRLKWLERRTAYIEGRLDDQIVWYEGRSDKHRRLGNSFFVLSVLAQIGAVAAAVFFALGHANAIGVFTTIAASIAAWIEFRRFEELEWTYDLARRELETIKERALAAKTDDELIDAVQDAESSISREHTIWAAKSKVSLAKSI